MLLSLENISITYVDKKILDDASMYIDYKDKIGIIGLNGSGKSTLLKIIAGYEEANKGTITKKDIDRIAYLPQDLIIEDDITIYEFVLSDNKKISEEKQYEIDSVLTKLGIRDFNRPMKNLSGGEKKRVMLATTLVKPCELLLLDEPTNHLDLDMIGWLEKYLIKYNGAILLVTHDRYFLDRIVNRIVDIEDGKLTTYDANYEKYLEQKVFQEEALVALERKRNSFLRKEWEWIKRGPQARETKDKRRIKQYEDLSKVNLKVKREIDLAYASTRLGRKTIAIDDISKKINERTLLSHFTYIVENDDRIGIVGANGIGKSTLLNLIAGIGQVDEGKIEIGETVKIGYFKQEVEAQNPKMRVIDYLNEIAVELDLGSETISSSKMLERFLFTPEMQYNPIEKLSGGEKRRLYLLKVLMTAPNILLLDEPTNDLDISTLAILEQLLSTFKGAVILVSHDRYFLDKTVDKIFEISEGGEVTQYPGGYSDGYSLRKIEALTSEKKTNVRIKPKTEKLSFNEKRELETIDDEISSIEEELKKVTEEINTSYAEYSVLASLLENQKELTIKLEEKIERWTYLNEKEERTN